MPNSTSDFTVSIEGRNVEFRPTVRKRSQVYIPPIGSDALEDERLQCAELLNNLPCSGPLLARGFRQ